MEDKSFELLTKMYGEFTEFKKDMTDFKKDMTDFRKETKSRLSKIETTLENDIKSNLKALHERAIGNTSKLNDHSEKISTIENKIDYIALSINSQDKRIETIEVRRKKSIK